MNRQTLIKTLVLVLINRKKEVDSSYFFNQIFTRLGIFNSVQDTINELNDNELIVHDGYFDGNSGFFRNISLSNKGKQYIQSQNTTDLYNLMDSEFENFSFLKPVFIPN